MKLVIKRRPVVEREEVLRLIDHKSESGLSSRELSKKFPKVQLEHCMMALRTLEIDGVLKSQWSPCTGDHAAQELRYWRKDATPTPAR